MSAPCSFAWFVVGLGLLGCRAPVGDRDARPPPDALAPSDDAMREGEPRADSTLVPVNAGSPERCNGPQYRVSSADGITLEPLDDAPPLTTDDEIDVSLRGDLDGDGRPDLILDLGMCGSWAHCVHVILLGCGGDRVSLASEPDLYVYGFELLAKRDGVLELWELTRGGSVDNDDVGRRRWIFEDGRARPTSDWQLIQRGPY